MKKIFVAAFAGLILSSGVMAQEGGDTGSGGDATTCAGGALTTGSKIKIEKSACSLLNEDVNINLSKDVTGAYVGDVDANVIRIATCHPNGRKNVTPAGSDTQSLTASSLSPAAKADA